MNKKWIILIVVLVLIVVGLGGYLVGQGGKNKEPSAEDLFPKIQEVSGAPKIECVGVEGKIEIAAQVNKEHWEKIGALSLEVKVKNVTNPGQTLLKAVLTKTLYDKSQTPIGLKNTFAADVLNLKPGEVATVNLDMISMSGNIDKVELSFRGDYKFAEAATPPPSPTTTQPAGNTYTTAPKNPQTPEEVVAVFYFLINDGKYLDAAKMIEKVESEIEAGKVSEEQAAADLGKSFQSGDLKSLRIKYVDVSSTPDRVYVGAVFYFGSGRGEKTTQLDLIKENGKWKIALSNF